MMQGACKTAGNKKEKKTTPNSTNASGSIQSASASGDNEAEEASGKGLGTEDDFLYEVAFEDFFAKYKPEVLEDAQVYRRLKELAEEYIMIYGYDENGFKINDPNCIYRSSRYWTYEELCSQIRILWSYEKA